MDKILGGVKMGSENAGTDNKVADKETLEVLDTILENSPAENMSPEMEKREVMAVHVVGKDVLDEVEKIMEKVSGQSFISEKQIILDTRFSSGVQGQLVKKVKNQQKEEGKKDPWKVPN
jgi:uncharacterized protein (DUF1697 family)